jgi:hypothetical protein
VTGLEIHPGVQEGRLLREPPDGANGSRGQITEGYSGLDPAVFDFRMSRRRAHEDHVLGMSLYPRDRFGHVRHERCLVQYQVIGREECNDRVRIVSDDPASRVENSGGRPAIERLARMVGRIVDANSSLT